MIKHLAILTAALFPCVASAADLPVKTPRAAPLPIFYGGSGAYCGAGAGGEATKVAGVNSPASYEAGGLINLGCGYTFAFGPDRFFDFHLNYAFSNTSGEAPCMAGVACSLDHKQSIDLKMRYGAPLSVLSGIFSGALSAFPALPAIPVGSINTTMHPYIAAGVRAEQDKLEIGIPGLANLVEQKKTRVRGILGVGAIYQTNTNTTVDTFADWTFGSGKFLLVPNSQIEVGSSFRFGVKVNYGLGG